MKFTQPKAEKTSQAEGLAIYCIIERGGVEQHTQLNKGSVAAVMGICTEWAYR